MKNFVKQAIPYVVIIVVVVLIRTFIATPIVVDGASMEPTLYDGNMMILNKLGKIERNDIVVVKYDNGYIIKRVIGLPNEEVDVLLDGTVMINGEELDYAFKDKEEESVSLTLDSDEYFVMGDNREVSFDSISFGPIKEEDIMGTSSFILWPFKSFGIVK